MSSGAAYEKVPTVCSQDCWFVVITLARPTSAILATPSAVSRMLDVLMSLHRGTSIGGPAQNTHKPQKKALTTQCVLAFISQHRFRCNSARLDTESRAGALRTWNVTGRSTND